MPYVRCTVYDLKKSHKPHILPNLWCDELQVQMVQPLVRASDYMSDPAFWNLVPYMGRTVGPKHRCPGPSVSSLSHELNQHENIQIRCCCFKSHSWVKSWVHSDAKIVWVEWWRNLWWGLFRWLQKEAPPQQPHSTTQAKILCQPPSLTSQIWLAPPVFLTRSASKDIGHVSQDVLVSDPMRLAGQ